VASLRWREYPVWAELGEDDHASHIDVQESLRRTLTETDRGGADGMHRSSDFSRRIGFLLGTVFLVAIFFIGRLIVIQVVDAKKLNVEAETHRTISRVSDGVRGDVVDANGHRSCLNGRPI